MNWLSQNEVTKNRNLDMSIEQLNNIHNDNEDEDAIYDSI